MVREMNRNDWLIFLACLAIDVKRQLMTLDTLAAEDVGRYGPLLMSLSPAEREAEIIRRHAKHRSADDALRIVGAEATP